MATLTLLTPVFNAAKTVHATLDSVRAQRPLDFEYIVVDGLSSDGTSEIIQESRDVVTRHVREADKGLYDAMNKGIGLAQGDIVGIINADDLLCPDALSRVVSTFAERDIDYVISDVNVITEAGEPAGLTRAQAGWLDGRRDKLGRDWRMNMVFPHPGIFVKRSVYQRLGVFNTDYRLCADHDFVARMINGGMRGYYLENKPLASFRLGGRSSSRLAACFKEDEMIARSFGVNPLLARMMRLRKELWVYMHRDQ